MTPGDSMSTSLTGEDRARGHLWSASPTAQVCLSPTDRSTGSSVSLFGSLPSVAGVQEAKYRALVEVDGDDGCPVSCTPVPRLILPLGCHLGFGSLASSAPAPQGLELSLPAQTADPWEIKDTPYLVATSLEPRAAAAPSGEPGSTSARPTSHTARTRWEPQLPPVSFR